MVRLDDLMSIYQEYKQEGRIRYVGMTTATQQQFPEFMAAMRTWRPDFIQTNYSIADRSAAAEVLPLAEELGIAVLNNVPFGGSRGSLFPLLSNYELPEWAVEFGIESWAQFMLKYNLAQSAITAIIPGTTKLSHLLDNQVAARGPLPDAELLGRMEAFWASIEP
jgi:aryl-alcohol dehydrogenase-like predicted oxidoreductase